MMSLRKHLPVSVSFCIQPETATKQRRGLSKKIDSHRLIATLTKFDPSELQRMPVNELSKQLTELLVEAALPQKFSQRKSPPWFDSTCYKTRRSLLALLKASPSCPASKEAYCVLRRYYRRLLELKKSWFAEEEERRMVLEAQEIPYSYIQRPTAFKSCPIPADSLRGHFQEMFQRSQTVPDALPETAVPSSVENWDRNVVENCQKDLLLSFSLDEVRLTIAALKNNKAYGADLVRNEHLKDAAPLLPLWTLLFNRCLADGTVPEAWLNCVLKVIPKGKGRLRPGAASRRRVAATRCYQVWCRAVSQPSLKPP